MTAARTVVSIPSQGTESPPMGGTLNESAVRTMFAPQVPGIANMVATSTVTTDASDGAQVTTWTFSPRTGNKG